MRRALSGIVVIAVLTAWLTPYAGAAAGVPLVREGVVLVASLTEGRELVYDITSRVESKRGEETDVLEQRARVRLRVKGKPLSRPIEGPWLTPVSVTFESLRARRHVGESDEAFRWDGGELPQGESAFARTYAALAKWGMELAVNDNGNVTGGSNPEVADVAAREVSALLGVFGSGAAARQFAPVFGLDPSRTERKAGDTWSRKHSQQILPGTEAVTTTTYTLDSVKGGEAALTGKLSMELVKHDSATKGVEPEVRATVREGKDAVVWDAAGARLVSRVLDSSVTISAKLAVEPPIESSTTTTLHVEVRVVPEGKEKRE
jgi:hypothetical protein